MMEHNFFLIFQPIYKTTATFSGLKDTISEWECKGLSNEKFKPPFTTNKIISQKPQWNKSNIKITRKLLKTRRYNTFYSKKCSKFIY